MYLAKKKKKRDKRYKGNNDLSTFVRTILPDHSDMYTCNVYYTQRFFTY